MSGSPFSMPSASAGKQSVIRLIEQQVHRVQHA